MAQLSYNTRTNVTRIRASAAVSAEDPLANPPPSAQMSQDVEP